MRKVCFGLRNITAKDRTKIKFYSLVSSLFSEIKCHKIETDSAGESA